MHMKHCYIFLQMFTLKLSIAYVPLQSTFLVIHWNIIHLHNMINFSLLSTISIQGHYHYILKHIFWRWCTWVTFLSFKYLTLHLHILKQVLTWADFNLTKAVLNWQFSFKRSTCKIWNDNRQREKLHLFKIIHCVNHHHNHL